MSNCLLCSQKLSSFRALSFFLSFRAERPHNFCHTCQKKFECLQDGPTCSGCGRPHQSSEKCADCQRWEAQYPPSLVTHQALYVYNDWAKDVMKQYKMQGDTYLAYGWAEAVSKQLRPFLKKSVLVPVPSSALALTRRGFNPVEVLLDVADLPYERALISMATGRNQSRKSRAERLRTPQVFELSHAVSDQLTGRRLVLIDDVYTTGRTLLHAKDCLRQVTPNLFSWTLFR